MSFKVLKKPLFTIISIFIFSFSVAQNNGPSSPDAASFEPVDATDMVNLATGDLSYVLPLLNIPSPEGGYPMALSYHAGIAMDQEASWVGLGWSINPGSLSRNVNGYPDDWKEGVFKEYYYDVGGEDSYFVASVGVSWAGAYSIGASASWGDNRAFGGSVNFGVGLEGIGTIGGSIGTNGGSINANIGVGGEGSPFSIGGSVGSNGVGVNLGFSQNYNNLNASFSLGADIDYGGNISTDASASLTYAKGEKNKKNSLGIKFSSNGIGIIGKINGAGTGMNLGFSQSITMNDYNITQSGWYIPLYIPIGNTGAVISGGFGKQKIKYNLDKTEKNTVSGPLYLNSSKEGTFGYWYCIYYTTSGVAGNHLVESSDHIHPDSNYTVSWAPKIGAFMDVKEVGITNASQKLDLSNNNAVFPNYDNYRVTAQGISGTIVPRMYETGALTGLSRVIEAGTPFFLEYDLPNTNAFQSDFTDFDSKVNFYFENEYSSSLIINPPIFNNSTTNEKIYNYLSSANIVQNYNRKKGGRFTEAYTNEQLADNFSEIYQQGFIKVENFNYNSEITSSDGIGAFKITAPDGKVYHYSLPVYNHEIVSRQFGIIQDRPNEDQAFFEKRQLKKYATHWLLTAITGPDFIDVNNNNIVDESDYGYWVSFDYGKWSDGYIWYAPYGEEYTLDEENTNIKSYTWGRKEVYYLDKVKTRTHTAIFVKEERVDGKGKALTYQHRKDKNTAVRSFNLKSQSLLRLKEIVLIKNNDLENLSLSKTNIVNLNSLPLAYNSNTSNSAYQLPWFDDEYGGSKNAYCSLQSNVLDIGDLSTSNWSLLKEKALKIIDLSVDYTLAQNSPYSSQNVNNGRLTLNGISFKGKKGVQLVPPYKFSYNNVDNFNIDKKDKWGYNSENPENWSLNEITNPIGAKIQIDYESDDFYAVFGHEVRFETVYFNNPDNSWLLSTQGVVIGLVDGVQINTGDPVTITTSSYIGGGEILTSNFNGHIGEYGTYYAWLGGDPIVGYLIVPDETLPFCAFKYFIGSCPTYITYKVNHPLKGGGLRVKELATIDGSNIVRNIYDYNNPNTNESSGKLSYIPGFLKIGLEIPYGTELPAPIVMYGDVNVTTLGADGVSYGYTKYEFNTFDNKTVDEIKFGNYFEISAIDESFYNTSEYKDVNISNITLTDNLSSLGSLISTKSYNSQNHLLSKMTNKYKAPNEINQGIIQESFQTYKWVDYIDNTSLKDKWHINSSTRIIYPSVLESTTVTQGGFTSTTYFDKHDYNTGQLLETRSYGSDGAVYKTELVPAYTKYPEMSSKVDNINNRNMLTQNTASYSYLFDKTINDWKEINTSVTTWNLYNNDIWRKHQNYIWEGSINEDGSYSGYIPFNWDDTSNLSSQWKKIFEITKYDHYSAALETMDINENYTSTKMCDADSKVMSVSNARYTEQYYAGAEYLASNTLYFDGEVKSTGRTLDTDAHTGSYVVAVGVGQNGFEVQVPSNTSRTGIKSKFKVSVWVRKGEEDNVKINVGGVNKDFNSAETRTAGDWVLLNGYIDIPTTATTVAIISTSGTVHLDDFRLLPVSSSMTGYVYNEWDELAYILGNSNLATKFIYDESGRLKETYIEVVDEDGVIGGFKKISEHNYHYAALDGGVVDPPPPTYDPLGATGLSPLMDSYIGTSLRYSSSVLGLTGGSGDFSYTWYYNLNYGIDKIFSTTCTTSCSYIISDYQNSLFCNLSLKFKCKVTDNVTGSSITVESGSVFVNCGGILNPR